KWLGHVPNEEKFDLLSKHDLLVLTSYNENFANVVIESLAMGTPVLISDEVGLADYVQETDLGWVSSLTIESIAEQLQISFDNKNKREWISVNSPKIIHTNFNEEVLVFDYIRNYNDLILSK
ncbi:MAG: glycosyltransferase, partial [Flavobacterium sp.]